jgi:hypothetical protein
MLDLNTKKEVLLTDVIDNLDTMVWIKDANNHLLYMNKSAINNLFKCNNDGEIDINKCPLSSNISSMTEEEVEVVEKIHIYGNDVYLKCRKIPFKNHKGMMVIAEDVTNKVKDNDKAVSILNDRIDKWKESREIKTNQSDVIIKNILHTVREIKRDRNIDYE